jgi:hypothetical protein
MPKIVQLAILVHPNIDNINMDSTKRKKKNWRLVRLEIQEQSELNFIVEQSRE